MNEKSGVLIAVLSSALGGGAAVATRYLIGSFDPIVLATVRFGGGALCLLPIALLLRPKWPPRQDWPAVAALGFIFFAVFLVFYNPALSYTTVGRGTLALSTLPLMTMVVGAVLGLEALTVRKTTGVLLAMCGVALALTTSLKAAPDGAWRGDLIMAGATICMALYNVYSRPYTQRSSPLGPPIFGAANTARDIAGKVDNPARIARRVARSFVLMLGAPLRNAIPGAA